MGIFGDIMNKLLHRSKASSPPQGSAASTGTTAPASGAPAGASPTGAPPPAASAAPATATLAQVDVEKVMDDLVKESGQTLDWRVSIVDTLKALGIDSSLDHRKALAKELNYSGSTDDSAAMNTWLHKQVMTQLAANGGKLPDSLKD